MPSSAALPSRLPALFRISLGGRVIALQLVGIALSLFLVSAVIAAVDVSWTRVTDLAEHWRDTEPESRGRLFRTEYVAAIERIKSQVPEDEPLYIVEGTPGNDSYLVRYDLAPRPLIYLGRLPSPSAETLSRYKEKGPRRVVVARIVDPWPELVPVSELLARQDR